MSGNENTLAGPVNQDSGDKVSPTEVEQETVDSETGKNQLTVTLLVPNPTPPRPDPRTPTDEPLYAPDPGLQGGTHETTFSSQILPPRQVMSRCLISFFRGYGLFHSFLPEVHTMNLYHAIYSPSYDGSIPTSTPTISNVELSFLLLTAAVGAVYVEGSDAPACEIREELFQTGKYHLDVAMKNTEKTRAVDGGGQDSQLEHTKETVALKITALAIVALYMIFQKEILARKYIEQAIHLAKSKGLAMIDSSPKATGMMEGGETLEPCTGGEWETWRRVWRSLVFLDGWYSASVGYWPVINSVDNCEPWNVSEKDQGLHAEMAKLGVLMSTITRDICAPETFEIVQVQEYSRQLKTWHDNLPTYLTLTEALDSKSDSAQRTSILLTHCAYLGSLILLTRRILVAQTKSLRGEMQQTVIGDTEHDMVELSQDCIYAARQLATVVGILYMEGRLMRKCWLGVHSAFTSCLIIFLELAVLRRQYNLRPQSTDSELVSRCIYALEYCATVDAAAKSFLHILVQIRNILFANAPDPLDTFPATPSHDSSYPTMVTQSRESSISSIKPPLVFTSVNPDGVRSLPPPSILTSYPDATTSRIFGGREGFETDAQSYHRGDQTIEFLVTHIMDCLESPYGGDHNVINESSHTLGSFPVNWRFLDPEPPRVHMHLADPAESPQLSPQISGHPSTSPIQGSSQHAFFSPPDHHPSITSSVAVIHNTDIPSNQHHKSYSSPGGPLPEVGTGNDGLPFKSVEEYKKFLKRIA